MSLLFVTDEKLRPLDRGMRVRISTLLAGCARSFAVTLVAPPPDDARERDAVAASCERVVWIGEQARATGLGGIADRWAAFRAAPGLRRGMRSYIPIVEALRAVDLGRMDLVWAERPHIARLFEGDPGRVIVDLDDLEHRRAARERAVRSGPRPIARAIAARYRAALYRDLELRSSRRYLAAVVCSDDDRAYMERMGSRNSIVVPNGVNEAAVGRWARRARPAGGPPRLVFLGNVAHAPNRDAIAYFADVILPLLRASDPALALDVIGPSVTPDLEERFAGRVRFHGYAEDLGEALAPYDVLVAPIRYGGGTRVKLLDALACRIPVVTTSAGAEGLPLEDGVHVLVGDDPARFAEQVLRVGHDAGLAERLVDAGARLIDERYRGAAIERMVSRLVTALAARAGPREIARADRPIGAG